MDEIDAALDFKNVGVIGEYIKERTKDAQFIVISLRNNMFELADTLCGIYKVKDTTRTLAIEPKKLYQEIVMGDQELLKIHEKHQENSKGSLAANFKEKMTKKRVEFNHLQMQTQTVSGKENFGGRSGGKTTPNGMFKCAGGRKSLKSSARKSLSKTLEKESV